MLTGTFEDVTIHERPNGARDDAPVLTYGFGDPRRAERDAVAELAASLRRCDPQPMDKQEVCEDFADDAARLFRRLDMPEFWHQMPFAVEPK